VSRMINHTHACRFLATLIALGFSNCACLAQVQSIHMPRTAVERARADENRDGVAEKVSLPVSFTVIGCVMNGQFTSESFSFSVVSYVNGVWQAASLGPYEGKTIRIDGMLSPGDRLSSSTFVIIDEKCRPDLHSSKFN